MVGQIHTCTHRCIFFDLYRKDFFLNVCTYIYVCSHVSKTMLWTVGMKPNEGRRGGGKSWESTHSLKLAIVVCTCVIQRPRPGSFSDQISSVIQSDLIRKRCLCVNVWRSVWSGSVLACVCECFFVCVHACAYAVWYPPGCVCLCTFINVRMSWCVHLFVSRTLPMCGHIKSAHTPQSLHCVAVIFHFTDTWACLISVTNSTWSNHELRHTSHKTDIHVSVHILTPMPVHARTLTSRHEWQVHPRLTHICTHVCTRNHRHSSCEGRSCWALRIDG